MPKFKGGITIDYDKKTASEEFELPYLPSDAAGLALPVTIIKVSEHTVEHGRNKGSYYYKVIFKIDYEGREYIRPLVYFNAWQIKPLLKFFKIKLFNSPDQLEGKKFSAIFDTDEKTGYINSIVSFDAVDAIDNATSNDGFEEQKHVDDDDLPF